MRTTPIQPEDMTTMVNTAAFLLVLFGSSVLAAQDLFPPVRITSDSIREGFPFWSLNGTRLAFASGRTGRGDIYLMDLYVQRMKEALAAAARQQR